MKNFNAELVLAANAELAEGPLWNAAENKLYWVDIDGKKLHIYDPNMDYDKSYETGGRIGVAGFMKDGRILGAIENELFIIMVTPGGLVMEKFLTLKEIKPDQRFNDGECDPAGRFLAGTISDEGNGHLFSIAPGGSYKVLLDGVYCSNGIAFSPDHKTMYYIDTMTKQVAAFDYDLEKGDISNRRVIRTFNEDEGFPDGMTSDRNGNLWAAHWGGHRATCFSPTNGEVLSTVHVPVNRVSSVAFGGPGLNTLYLTTARVEASPGELESEPLSGGIFRADVGICGIEPSLFG